MPEIVGHECVDAASPYDGPLRLVAIAFASGKMMLTTECHGISNGLHLTAVDAVAFANAILAAAARIDAPRPMLGLVA